MASSAGSMDAAPRCAAGPPTPPVRWRARAPPRPGRGAPAAPHERNVSALAPPSSRRTRRRGVAAALGTALALGAWGVIALRAPGPPAPEASVAVLPFLDLSPDSSRRYLAD